MGNHFIKNLGHWQYRVKRSMQHLSGRKYWSMFKEGSIGYQIHGQPSVLDTGEPEVGDLAIVPCEMWLGAASVTGGVKSYQNLPRIGPDSVKDAASLRFVLCDKDGKPSLRPAIKPLMQLVCVADIELYLTVSGEEFVESSLMTKLWDMNLRMPGLFRHDYILKTQPDGFTVKRIDLFMLAWHDMDSFSVIPGLVERRPRKNWFQTEIAPGIYKATSNEVTSASSEEIELPLVGTLGFVVDKKLLSHGLDEFGAYVKGTEYQSWFYKIMFSDRQPMWVFGPVWKSPKELILPIYLPVS